MKIRRRQDRIIEIIRKNERTTVEELADQLEISRETIRRDLTDLANADKIRKIHGGATLPHTVGEGSFQQRMSDNVVAKTQIADTAAQLFKPGETLFVDTGSTTLYFAEKLAFVQGLTIITNSTEIAKACSYPETENHIFLLGGEFNIDNQQTVGAMVTSQIGLFRAHHAVLTIGALDGRTGAMDFNIGEAQIARAMIEQSQSVTILMDSSKFDRLASFEVCPLARIDRLVADRAPPLALAKLLEANQVETITAS